MSLSERASATYLKNQEFLMKCFSLCLKNPYCKKINKDGMVNMGTAVNQLSEDILQEKLNQPGMFEHKPDLQHYCGLNGTLEFTKTLANFFISRLSNGVQIYPENIRVVNGVSSALEALAFCICDPGDVILIALPTYARFIADMGERSNAKLVGIELTAEDNFALKPERFEEELLKLQEQGEKVRGIILCNPSNPIGKVYDEETVDGFLDLCIKYNIHLIADEIYALSIYDNSKFFSVLNYADNQTKGLVHFLWGFSKDFGIAGFRLGVIHTHSKDMLQAIDGLGIYVSVSTHIQQVCNRMLLDTDWLDKIYFPNNIKRLRQSFETVKEVLGDLDIRIVEASAGLFCWLDFSKYIEEKTIESEIKLFKRFFDDGKVYIVPGSEFGCTTPGWFRIIISVSEDILRVGLTRIKQILTAQQ